eukprot:scaffold8318_cov99-Isochrysis_galbana.AAC.5
MAGVAGVNRRATYRPHHVPSDSPDCSCSTSSISCARRPAAPPASLAPECARSAVRWAEGHEPRGTAARDARPAAYRPGRQVVCAVPRNQLRHSRPDCGDVSGHRSLGRGAARQRRLRAVRA